MIKRQRLTGCPWLSCRNLKRGRVCESGIALTDRDIASAGQLGQAPCQRGNHFFLAGPQGVNIDRGFIEVNAPGLHFSRFCQHATDVQKGFRRNAPAEQAGAAKTLIPFNQHHLHAQIGG